MRNVRRSSVWLIVLVLAVSAAPALAQESNNEARNRLFLSFVEEATLVDRQWWEGQLEYQDVDAYDATILSGIVAIQPWKRVEVGGRVGFGDTSADTPLPEGRGATDFDTWVKYHFGDREKTEFAAGALLTIPAGDDAVGLGTDAFGLGAFGSMKHRGKRFIYTGNVSIRSNGDGMLFGNSLDGETSIGFGGGIIIPADKISFVGELRFETERFDGFDEDARLLGGINIPTGERGMLRIAATAGLADGAPDFEIITGFASTF